MSHDLKALRELERRLAEAKGPDSYADCVLYTELGSASRGDPGYPNGPTASLDAAVALVERVLPGAEITLRMGSKNSEGHPLDATARLALPFKGSFGLMFRYQPEAPHKDVRLALCLATIRAIIAQGEP